jgi:hypothetical protein
MVQESLEGWPCAVKAECEADWSRDFGESVTAILGEECAVSAMINSWKMLTVDGSVN